MSRYIFINHLYNNAQTADFNLFAIYSIVYLIII